MPLELESFRKAVATLTQVLDRSEDAGLMASLDEVTRSAVRAGVIQHFEIAYELAWKFLKRWLEQNVSPGGVDGITRRELFRRAAENLLIEDVETWMRYHEARNRTSHTYDAGTAERVYRAALSFSRDVESLLMALEERND